MKGSQGRPSSKTETQYEPYKKFNISLPPELYLRLHTCSEEQERAKSWIIKKALEEWLTKEGY